MLEPDVLRYGPTQDQGYSRLGESIYDHPFQWGSKRTGPDLAREGDQRNNLWQYQHLMDPRSISPGSNMPSYAHLKDKSFDQRTLPKKIAVLTQLGVPYPVMDGTAIKEAALEQGAKIATDLHSNGQQVRPDSELVAILAYLQKLGKYDKPTSSAKPDIGIPFPLIPHIPDSARNTK
jgi:cytochrome c oxidase cbb3-type subunit I/II